jgi:hypothetical protein
MADRMLSRSPRSIRPLSRAQLTSGLSAPVHEADARICCLVEMVDNPLIQHHKDVS